MVALAAYSSLFSAASILSVQTARSAAELPERRSVGVV
jgi:hypothetical protein